MNIILYFYAYITTPSNTSGTRMLLMFLLSERKSVIQTIGCYVCGAKHASGSQTIQYHNL